MPLHTVSTWRHGGSERDLRERGGGLGGLGGGLTFFARNLARNGDDGEDDVRGGATARVPADREATVSSVGTPTLARRSELRRPLAAVKPRGQRGGQSQAARMLAQTGGRCWTSEWDPSPRTVLPCNNRNRNSFNSGVQLRRADPPPDRPHSTVVDSKLIHDSARGRGRESPSHGSCSCRRPALRDSVATCVC